MSQRRHTFAPSEDPPGFGHVPLTGGGRPDTVIPADAVRPPSGRSMLAPSPRGCAAGTPGGRWASRPFPASSSTALGSWRSGRSCRAETEPRCDRAEPAQAGRRARSGGAGRATGRRLVGLGIAIARRSTLHDVSDVDILPAEPEGADHRREKLTRAAHERFSETRSSSAPALRR